MKTVFLVDLIGTYCGCNYYDDSFAEKLNAHGYNVEIISTYNHGNKKPFLPVIFKKNKVASILTLMYAYIKFLTLVIRNRGSIFVYITYGEFYDILFLTSSWFSKYVVADVHEVHALKYRDDSRVSRFFNWFYTKYLHNVIYHSERTNNILKKAGIKCDMMYVPHFKYAVKKDYEEASLSNDIKKSFCSDKVKFLFFGNISKVKGIDVIVDFFSNLDPDFRDKVEVVIAGKNVENIDFTIMKKYNNYHIIDRHINDDELIYLYGHTDYVLLAYRKSSQSGIFEMATCFRKPMVLTNIPYFHKMISDFPSFGVETTLEDYGSTLKTVIEKHHVQTFFTKEDCDRNELKQDIENFFVKFNAKFA